MTPRVYVMDACSLLNLLATGREVELATALGALLVSSAKARAETQFLCGPPDPEDEEGHPTKVPVNLEPLIRAGRLEVRVLGDESADVLADCAQYLRDADASAVALASTLGAPLVSDDGKVQKVARRLYPDLAVVSTLQLVREAAERAKIMGRELVTLAQNLHDRGNFDPPRRDPEREWFENLLRSRF